jgi:hypothetical protein
MTTINSDILNATAIISPVATALNHTLDTIAAGAGQIHEGITAAFEDPEYNPTAQAFEDLKILGMGVLFGTLVTSLIIYLIERYCSRAPQAVLLTPRDFEVVLPKNATLQMKERYLNDKERYLNHTSIRLHNAQQAVREAKGTLEEEKARVATERHQEEVLQRAAQEEAHAKAAQAQEEAAQAQDEAERAQDEAARQEEAARKAQDEAAQAQDEAAQAQEEAARAQDEAARAQEEAAQGKAAEGKSSDEGEAGRTKGSGVITPPTQRRGEEEEALNELDGSEGFGGDLFDEPEEGLPQPSIMPQSPPSETRRGAVSRKHRDTPRPFSFSSLTGGLFDASPKKKKNEDFTLFGGDDTTTTTTTTTPTPKTDGETVVVPGREGEELARE